MNALSSVQPAPPVSDASAVATAVAAVVAAGRSAALRGWVPATSGNFSVRIDAETVALTRSGVDKGRLTPDDVLIQPVDAPPVARASAETPLHLGLYRARPEIGAIFHTHSPAASVIGAGLLAEGAVRISGWELQKALASVRTHEATVEVPIFANDQDTAALAERIAERQAQPVAGVVAAPGYLLAGHGLYAWGATAAEAERHLEALEVLFAQILALKQFAA
ncbi:methylthioribulose 1-phosphate dehydratase [Siculibacillus lacustris]|uniref:Methylthioribulose-1-phosphate dehydratase n=1 Tax=Siculibacillus lacustris TaxID=1549641 RepID=A0A4Q9VXR4_9HYPH|nr:methylthioribulose 1-phosphate dehydratase [Siculibacillus lacustris]TBW41296.1 methylthioribulose 1-phosphate dehydratase [Siculibacillus lacustris]